MVTELSSAFTQGHGGAAGARLWVLSDVPLWSYQYGETNGPHSTEDREDPTRIGMWRTLWTPAAVPIQEGAGCHQHHGPSTQEWDV